MIPIKSSFNCASVKSLKEYSSMEQYQYVEGLQFEAKMCGLSLLAIFTF